MSIGRWMDKDVVHICSSAIKKSERMPFAVTQVQLKTIILRKVGQEETNAVWYHSYESRSVVSDSATPWAVA